MTDRALAIVESPGQVFERHGHRLPTKYGDKFGLPAFLLTGGEHTLPLFQRCRRPIIRQDVVRVRKVVQYPGIAASCCDDCWRGEAMIACRLMSVLAVVVTQEADKLQVSVGGRKMQGPEAVGVPSSYD